MLRIILILILGTLSNQIYGQEGFLRLDSLASTGERPKVGLVLSGGAAHGLAHIGVIQYLDELGIEIDYISGTSMGAIIGALYSMGYNGNKIEQIASELDWTALLNNEIPLNGVAAVEKLYHNKYPLTFVIDDNSLLLPQGFLNTNRLELELARLFSPAANIEDFNDLPIPFQCFGVDIEKGEIVTLDNGRLAKALRASMAIPSVFAPKYYQGKYFVDGGLMRNFPVSDNIAMGAELVIGSYVGREKADISKLRTLVDIMTEAAFMMSIVDSEKQKELTDLLLQPDVKGKGVFDFNDYQFFIERGYESASRNKEALMKLAKMLQQYPKNGINPLDDPGFVFIDSIKINEMPVGDIKLIQDKLALKERSYMTFKQIEKGINRISSTLNFESVSYDVVQNKSGHFLLIEAVPREEKKIGVNINHFSTTNSSLILNGQIRNFLFRLSNLRATIRLSDNAAFGGEYFLRGGLNNKNWVFGARMEAQRYDLVFESKGSPKKNGFMWEGFITPYLTYEFNNVSSLRAEYSLKRYDFRNEIRADVDIKRYVESGSNLSLILDVDDRDARAFTKTGLFMYSRIGLGFINNNDVSYTLPDASSSLTFPRAENFIEGELFISRTIPVSDKVWWTFMGDFYFKNKASLLDNYTVGGTSLEGIRNLPFIGFREEELRMDQHLYGRTEIRIGMFDNVSVSIVGNIIVGESQVFQYSDHQRDTRFTAYGLGFEFGIMLPIGPLIFDIGYNSEAETVRTALSLGWRHFF
ncbi:MAG: patatin-like phospholipase family protein [Saprospiraceae bacterium]|nr:patatin-like phospholipase family protein [Saprospiraceae bacterium]